MQKKSKFNVFTFMLLIILSLTFLPAIPSYAACPDDISSYWKLDEPTPGAPNGTYVDFIKDNDGTGNVNPTAATGIVNGAQDFNGTDTEINVPADRSFNWQSNESFSIEFWVNIDSGTPIATQVIIGRVDALSSLQWFVGINGGDDKITFALRDTTGAGAAADLIGVGTIDLTDGSWHHVVAVRDESTDGNFIYVDGALQGNSTFNYGAGFGSSTAALNIGHFASSFYFDGLIDEVALYDRALEPAEIQAHSAAGLAGDDYCLGGAPFVPFPDDTISLWQLDETAGPDYLDSFDGNDGTGSANVTAATGTVNGAQDFNGTDTEINVPADRSFNWQSNESFSIEFWVNIDSGTPIATQVIIGRVDALSSLQWFVGINGGDDKITFALRDTTGAGAAADLIGVGTIDLTDGSWHHVVAVRDESTDGNFIYVDGALQGNSTFNYGAGFGSSTAALNIGHFASSFYFDGLIDEVALYDRALPLAEIQAHRDAGLAGDAVQSLRPPPVADAGTAQTNIKEGTTGVTLDGSGSGIGYAGTAVTYLWEQTAGTAVISFAGTTTDTATFTAPDVAAAGETLTFQLTVNADDGQSSTDTVTVGVVDKVAPFADAGPDQPNVTEGDTVTLNGSGSSDADGTIATYLWEQVTGTAVTLTPSVASATPTATFTAPDVAAAGETLTFKLTVTDDDGLTDSGNMAVTVADATGALQADAGADQTVAPGASVTLDASASTGTNPTYAWIQTAGTTVQLAGDDTANPTFTAPTAADISAAVLDTLTFQLTVTDASGSSTDDVNVIIDDSVGRSGGGGGGGGGGCFINSMF